MEHGNASYMREYLLTCLTCGLAVLLAGSLAYFSYEYPQELEGYLSSAWIFLSTRLAFVGSAASFIFDVVTYPFVFVYKAVIGATALFWILLLGAYLWCSCIAHHLKKKGITTKVYKAFDKAAAQLGACFVILVYLAIFGRSPDFITGFIIFSAFTMILLLKFDVEVKVEKEKDKKEKAMKASAEGNQEAVDLIQTIETIK